MRKNASLIHTLDRPVKSVYIYALCDPDTKIVRYIGLATNGFERIKQHYKCGVSKIEGKTSLVKLWIHRLRKESKIFTVEYLEYFDSDGPWLDEAEIRYIDSYIKSGVELLNHELGGRRNGFKYINKEANTKRLKEVNGTPEKRKFFSETSKKMWANPEHREMMKNLPKTPISEEGKKNIHEGMVKAFGVKLEDDLGNTFNSLQEASDFHKIHKMSIQRASLNNTIIHGRTFKRLGGGRKDPSQVITDTYIKKGYKPIFNEVIDQNGVIYQNVTIAARELGIDKRRAFKLLSGEQKTTHSGITLKKVNK